MPLNGRKMGSQNATRPGIYMRWIIMWLRNKIPPYWDVEFIPLVELPQNFKEADESKPLPLHNKGSVSLLSLSEESPLYFVFIKCQAGLGEISLKDSSRLSFSFFANFLLSLICVPIDDYSGFLFKHTQSTNVSNSQYIRN